MPVASPVICDRLPTITEFLSATYLGKTFFPVYVITKFHLLEDTCRFPAIMNNAILVACAVTNTHNTFFKPKSIC